MNKHARLLTMLALWLLAAVAHAGTVTYVYTDPQGTPLAEADAQGNITARFEYTPYGVSVPSMGAAPNGVGYTGHVNDPETGLVYMQARYYDAEVGRFLSVDPVGPSAGNEFNFNRYAYSINNPIRYVDPNGREPKLPIMAQLTYARNYIKNEYQKVMVAIGLMGQGQAARVSVSLSLTLVNGTGLVGSKGLYNSSNSLGVIYLGKQGVEASIDAKYRAFTINAPFYKKSPFEITAHATRHGGFLGGGGELVWNAGGSLSGYLLAGVGVGDAAYVGSVNYDLGENSKDGSDQDNDDRKRQQQWEDEQEMRRVMGFGPEIRDYLH